MAVSSQDEVTGNRFIFPHKATEKKMDKIYETVISRHWSSESTLVIAQLPTWREFIGQSSGSWNSGESEIVPDLKKWN